jgi:diguanylate cyclase (GGDEF)-like protein/PAS domain S-box-containing protein
MIANTPPKQKSWRSHILGDEANSHRLLLEATGVFLLAVVIATQWAAGLVVDRIAAQRVAAVDTTRAAVVRLQLNMSHALSATTTLAALVKQGRGQVANFETVGASLLQLYPGIGAVQLAPDGVVRKIAPLAGNEKAIGYDLLADPQRTKEAFLARDTSQLTLAGPFNLVQGGLGAVGRLPVFLPDAGGRPVFWGFTSVLIRFPAMLDTAGFTDIEHKGYCWVLWRVHPDTGQHQVIASSGEDTLDAPASLAMPVPNGEWTFSVAPVTGWGDTAYQRNTIALSLLISLLVSLVYFLVRRYPILLRVEVEQRTRIESEEALRIAATAFEAQQGMIITNAQHVILRVNQAFTDMTGYSAEEAVGQNPRIMKSDRHDSAFYTAMMQGMETEDAWAGEIWNRRKNGEVYPEWLSISAVKNGAGQTTHYVSIFSDISERVKAQTQIETLAFYDPLTKLPNRRLLLDRLEQALHASTRHARKSALLFVDLDNFKTVNDTVGHHQGDLLLLQVAQRLKTCVREGDTIAHLGSDEFVVILEDLNEDTQEAANQAEIVGEKILTALAQDYTLAGGAHHSTASVGVTLFGGEKQESTEEPLKRAELAMFQAKAARRNTLRFFDAQMQANASARAALEADLREAIQQQQFVLYYQPQVVGEGRITGVEALVRWQHPQRGMVSPAEFIPLAEECGLILAIGQWVLETACTQLAAWAQQPKLAHLSMAVNVSAHQFRYPGFVDQVLAVLEHTGATPKLLKLELTESMFVDNVESIIAKMGVLKDHGVSFSLDDFGTGYSSLSYLKRLPLDQLKIDQGFVRDIITDPNDAAIAKMVVVLAESMGLSVIAEGVELQAQADYLSHLGCHAYQGYLFSRPLPLSELEAFVLQAPVFTA